MNVVEPPPMQPGDDLDRLLRTFLQSQLPKPWPRPRLHSAVSSCQRRPANGRNLMRSRWTLAASVALLLFGSWLLPNRFPSNPKTGHGPDGAMIGSDDIRRELRNEQKKQRRIENKNKTGLAADDGEPIPELEQSDLPMLR
jgi:hypothetical protein